jgi:ribosome-associated translation inhibitor RaiA/cold shock CspA family protein
VQTPLQITFRNIQSSEFLESRIRERVDRLERHFREITACRVVVEVPHRSPGSGKTPLGVMVEVEIPGRMLVSKEEEDPPREAKGYRGGFITRVFDAMERQLEEEGRIRRRDVKDHESALEAGRIARLFPDQHYGFVEIADGPDLYFTENALQGLKFGELEQGMMVAITRATGEGPMGPQASSVRKLSEETRMRSG